MSPACLPANAESFSYPPGAALCRFRASSDSCFCEVASSAELVATSGALVSGLHPARHGADFGFLDFLCFVCAEAPGSIVRKSSAATIVAQSLHAERR